MGPLAAVLGFFAALIVTVATLVFAINVWQDSGFLLGPLLGGVELAIALWLTWSRHRSLARGIVAGGVLFAILAVALLIFGMRGGFQLGHD